MKSFHILGWFFIFIIGFSLVGWIFYDITSSAKTNDISIKILEGQVCDLEKKALALETNRYVVYINVDTQDTLFLPAFEEIPENEIDTVNQRSEKEE